MNNLDHLDVPDERVEQWKGEDTMPNEALVCGHARQGWFPANSISAVLSVIDPTTAEAQPV